MRYLLTHRNEAAPSGTDAPLPLRVSA